MAGDVGRDREWAPDDEDDGVDKHQMDATRYERTSELIKAFKHACARVREEFHTLEMELPDFTAVLDELTKNTYVLIVVHDPTIGVCLPPSLPLSCSVGSGTRKSLLVLRQKRPRYA